MNSSLRSILFLFGAGLLPLCAFGQDNYVPRYDAFVGFVYFESPLINLAERGYHMQFGYNLKPWLAAGFDYSNANGTLNLIPNYLPGPLKDEANSTLTLLINNGYLPKTYKAAVPIDTLSQTFALGPAIIIRHFHKVAIIVHPSFGALRELATPHAQDAITQVIVNEFLPGKNKLDWTGFYGIGGGLDFSLTRHIGLRMHTDLVWDHVINDILGSGHWTIRASIGPSFHLGKNISR